MRRRRHPLTEKQIPQEQLAEPKAAYHQGHCKKRRHGYLCLSANSSPQKGNSIPESRCDIAHQKGCHGRSGSYQQTAGSKELYVTPANAAAAKQIHKSQKTACEKGAAQPVHKEGADPAASEIQDSSKSGHGCRQVYTYAVRL